MIKFGGKTYEVSLDGMKDRLEECEFLCPNRLCNHNLVDFLFVLPHCILLGGRLLSNNNTICWHSIYSLSLQYDNAAVYMVVLERVVLEASTYYTNFLDLN